MLVAGVALRTPGSDARRTVPSRRPALHRAGRKATGPRRTQRTRRKAFGVRRPAPRTRILGNGSGYSASRGPFRAAALRCSLRCAVRHRALVGRSRPSACYVGSVFSLVVDQPQVRPFGESVAQRHVQVEAVRRPVVLHERVARRLRVQRRDRRGEPKESAHGSSRHDSSSGPRVVSGGPNEAARHAGAKCRFDERRMRPDEVRRCIDRQRLWRAAGSANNISSGVGGAATRVGAVTVTLPDDGFSRAIFESFVATCSLNSSRTRSSDVIHV